MLSEYISIWDKLTSEDQKILQNSSSKRHLRKGDVVHKGESDCVGLLVVCNGQLRAYINSDDGREVTIYRLFERDICLLSASCMMVSIQFEVTIEAEKDSDIYVIPSHIYQKMMENSAPLANFTIQLISTRFTDVMWFVEQIMWKSFDKRLSAFLIEECKLEKSNVLLTTHEKIALHLGTAREVVTRMLKYFQDEGFVVLSRGSIEIVDSNGLAAIYE
ncbi:MAG TPA: Crp/Fnr family transcriptional regulator [Saccharofermentans sp.]|mgnify:FL=1|nr:Crp/Fnr family transcriptional regulator [Saccharofermentans sp.]HPQ32372.1 Crp/Fnr family transcriptional regulator [Saccharofermentans sp.]